ncbi:MAG TPA: hypothetical protein VF395_14245 [Polyangiaceae bacterium]
MTESLPPDAHAATRTPVTPALESGTTKPREIIWEGTARYRVLRVLGRGGMGVVYEALDGETGLAVALTLRPRSRRTIAALAAGRG